VQWQLCSATLKHHKSKDSFRETKTVYCRRYVEKKLVVAAVLLIENDRG
jgi:hypothetical protein